MQVFANLIHNSAQHTDSGGRICSAIDCEGEHAIVTVDDNGIGIPASALDEVKPLLDLRKHHGRLGYVAISP